MTKRLFLFLVPAFAIAITTALAADLPRTKAPADVQLYIISPKDGETVTSPVTVRFGLRGMGIAPAGVAFGKHGTPSPADRRRAPRARSPDSGRCQSRAFRQGSDRGRHHARRRAAIACSSCWPIISTSRTIRPSRRSRSRSPSSSPARGSPCTCIACCSGYACRSSLPVPARRNTTSRFAAERYTTVPARPVSRATSRSRAIASSMSARRRRARRSARWMRRARPSRPASSTCFPGRTSRS